MFFKCYILGNKEIPNEKDLGGTHYEEGVTRILIAVSSNNAERLEETQD